MLSREIMGVFCLGVVWVTALLVAVAAWQDLRDLRAIAGRAKHVIVGMTGSDLAQWTVEQTARAIDASDEAIVFHERGFKSEIFGGNVLVGDVTYEVEPSTTGQVWVADQARGAAIACTDTAAFDAVYVQARKAKGFRRDVHVRIGKGERVFVIGEVDKHQIRPEIVSTIDPVAFCRQKATAIALFVPAELVVCAMATWVALQVPHFGRTSVVGAVLCFAFFLGVTPMAVALRERVRRPHEAFLRPHWSRTTVSGVKPTTPAQRLTQRKT